MRIAQCSAVLLCASVVSGQDLSSSKRGLVYVSDTKYAGQDAAIWDGTNSDITWYYNYNVMPTAIYNNKLQFVPMLWGNSTTFYDSVKSLKDSGMNISYVLGFNEPDSCISGGSCLDAVTAAETWIREIEPLKNLGISLGAPAVTGAPTGFNWLQNFFTQCDGGCTPSFIPVHYYGDFQGLASHLGQVNGTYPNMTTWVTEYNLPDASLSDTQEFYNQSSSYFDRLSFVTRYSMFGAFRSDVSNVGPNAAMLTQNGQLTDIGAWYLGQPATGNVPSGDASVSKRFTGWALLSVLVCLASLP